MSTRRWYPPDAADSLALYAKRVHALPTVASLDAVVVQAVEFLQRLPNLPESALGGLGELLMAAHSALDEHPIEAETMAVTATANLVYVALRWIQDEPDPDADPWENQLASIRGALREAESRSGLADIDGP